MTIRDLMLWPAGHWRLRTLLRWYLGFLLFFAVTVPFGDAPLVEKVALIVFGPALGLWMPAIVVCGVPDPDTPWKPPRRPPLQGLGSVILSTVVGFAISIAILAFVLVILRRL